MVAETLASRPTETFPRLVENCPKLSTDVEDTPTICRVCELSGVPYIVVKLSKEKVPSERNRG